MYAEKIANNVFHLSPETPGARVEGVHFARKLAMLHTGCVAP